MIRRAPILLLILLLGSLALRPPPLHDSVADPARQAAVALGAWLGGPIALCLPGSPDGPMPEGDPAGHTCCPTPFGRGLDLPPLLLSFVPPRIAPNGPIDWRAAGTSVRDRAWGPQQPRAPPQRASLI